MSQISSNIPSFLNGVSQQPQTLRRPSQATEQINMRASPVDGLGNRMGTKHKVQLSGTVPAHIFRHTIDRDRTERYAVTIADGVLTVYDLINDTFATVNTPDGTGYLADPQGFGFRAVTAKDFTFIANRGVDVAMDPATSAVRPKEAVVSVKAGSYSKTYKIIIDGTTQGSFTTRDSSTTAHEGDVDTTYIAQQLVDSVNASVATPDVTATRYGSDIYLVTPGGEDFVITTEDGFAGNNLVASKGTTRKFDDLPTDTLAGVKIKVEGDPESDADDYWLEYGPDDIGTSIGTWKESVGPGVELGFDASTMPHVLVRETDGTFTFRQSAWEDRTVGDDTSAPVPSFVGQKISHVFFHRNRLGFLSGENLITSRGGGEQFNFFRRTMLSALDSDPIDVAAEGDSVDVLLDTVEYNQDLVVRSGKTQYVLTGTPLLTPSEASMKPRSRYETSALAVPIVIGNKGAGDRVYMPFVRGPSSGIWELSIIADTASNLADDITEHAPTYIKGEFLGMVGSATERMIVGFTDGEPNALQVYEFLWGEGQKLQAALSKWKLEPDATIIDLAFIESELLITYAHGTDGIYLDTLDVSPGQKTTTGETIFQMDRKVEFTAGTGTYDGTNTTWTLPYTTDEDLWVIVEETIGTKKRGLSLNHTRPTSTTLQVTGDYSAVAISVGTKIAAEYILSNLYLRSSRGNGSIQAIADGRTQISRIEFNLSETGYLEVHVTPSRRDTRVTKFTGKTLGTTTATIGAVSIEETGRLRVRVNARNTDVEIKLVTDHYLPAFVTGADWEGTHSRRTRKT